MQITVVSVKDINECETGSHSCGPRTECSNSNGFYTCIGKKKLEKTLQCLRLGQHKSAIVLVFTQQEQIHGRLSRECGYLFQKFFKKTIAWLKHTRMYKEWMTSKTQQQRKLNFNTTDTHATSNRRSTHTCIKYCNQEKSNYNRPHDAVQTKLFIWHRKVDYRKRWVDGENSQRDNYKQLKMCSGLKRLCTNNQSEMVLNLIAKNLIALKQTETLVCLLATDTSCQHLPTIQQTISEQTSCAVPSSSKLRSSRRSRTSDMNTSRVSVTRMATGGRRPVNRAARDALMPDARDRWRKKKKKGSAPDVECRSPVKVLARRLDSFCLCF